jgi:hypothetical protein
MTKAPLPQRYLAKKGGKWLRVRLIDVLILIHHIMHGAREDRVGFEDANRTLAQVLGHLNKKVSIDPAVLESALWSCNLMDEIGKWWHPEEVPFKKWVKRLLGKGRRFNFVYNWIEIKGEHND